MPFVCRGTGMEYDDFCFDSWGQVLGTDAGGTTEIVEQNVTGLLHPVGRPGSKVLTEHLRYLLKNPSVRQQMGLRGREKVEKMYLKRHMYKLFFEVLFKCMRIK